MINKTKTALMKSIAHQQAKINKLEAIIEARESLSIQKTIYAFENVGEGIPLPSTPTEVISKVMVDGVRLKICRLLTGEIVGLEAERFNQHRRKVPFDNPYDTGTLDIPLTEFPPEEIKTVGFLPRSEADHE